MEIRTEEWYDKAWSIVRGPLVFALKMNENWSWKAFEGRDRYYGEGAWEVTSDTPWNYCLMREEFSPDKCQIEFRPNEILCSGPIYYWSRENCPVKIRVPARTLLSWTNIDSVAYWTEDGMDVGEECTIELIPYGCTSLRIAEFPTRIIPWDLSFKETY